MKVLSSRWKRVSSNMVASFWLPAIPSRCWALSRRSFSLSRGSFSLGRR
jgi:hypothetical protein